VLQRERAGFTAQYFVFGTLQHGERKLLPLLQPDLFAQLLSGFKDQTVAASELGVDVSLPFASAHRIVR